MGCRGGGGGGGDLRLGFCGGGGEFWLGWWRWRCGGMVWGWWWVGGGWMCVWVGGKGRRGEDKKRRRAERNRRSLVGRT